MPDNKSAVLFTLNQLLKPDSKRNIEIDNTFNYQRNMHIINESQNYKYISNTNYFPIMVTELV